MTSRRTSPSQDLKPRSEPSEVSPRKKVLAWFLVGIMVMAIFTTLATLLTR